MLLTLIVVLLTLVPVEVGTAAIPLMRPTANAILLLTAVVALASDSTYICSSERNNL